MSFTFFPVVNGATVKAGGDSEAKAEPGAIYAYRWSDGQWCLVQYVQNGNVAALNAGYVAIPNDATLKQYSVMKAGTSQKACPIAGIALATIASQYFGWMVIQGFHASAVVATTAAGEYLCVGGSVSAQLSNNISSSWFHGTDVNASGCAVVAVAKEAVTATTTASIQLIGMWGV